MNHYVHIGLEMHCELSTQSKMFSHAPAKTIKEPNSCVDLLDFGFPGTLPTVNKKAVEYGLLICDLLHCEIDKNLRFDRKNYTYADLPKGYQITQQNYPLGKNGHYLVHGNKIHIQRIHLEEDTAKMIHKQDQTYIDFNRCGYPLVEIVTDASINRPDIACEYVRSLVLDLIYLQVTEGKMENGNIRCDVNVSVTKNPDSLGSKVEIKNINSISNMKRALDHEIKRQSELLDQGIEISEQTRRYDETTKTTVLLRKKDTARDYRYLPEPNIPVIHLDESWIRSIRENRPMLPDELILMLNDQYGLSFQQAEQLVSQKELTDFFLKVIKYTDRYLDVFSFLMGDIRSWMKENHREILNQDPKVLGDLICKMDSKLSRQDVRTCIIPYLEHRSIDALIEKLESAKMDNLSLNLLIDQVLKENQKSVADYKNGRDRALGYLVGQVMKCSKGRSDPKIVHDILLKRLEEAV